jgi:hypothetical protein
VAGNVPPEVAHHRARVAGLVSRGADPADVEVARGHLRAAIERAAFDKHIEELEARAPWMTAEQRDRLVLAVRTQAGEDA